MEWVFSGNAWKHWKSRSLDPSQRNKNNLELWLDAMDWSQIESLGVVGHSDALQPISHLDSLRTLEYSVGDAEDALKFIQGLKNASLTHLVRTDGPLLPLSLILEHQGESLQSLDLYNIETMARPSPTYNDSELELLSHMAPNLNHLSINLHRNGTWPLESLKLIASIPSLQSLDLWLDITSDCRRQAPEEYTSKFSNWELVNQHCKGEGQYQQPFVNDTSSLEAFEYMRENKVGVSLKNVTFRVGDWSRSWDGPLYFPDWLEGRRAAVECSAPNDEDAFCIVTKGQDYWIDGRH